MWLNDSNSIGRLASVLLTFDIDWSPVPREQGRSLMGVGAASRDGGADDNRGPASQPNI